MQLQQSHAELMERARLESEATVQQKSLQRENSLKELTTNSQLNDAHLESEKRRIERAQELKICESELAAIVMQEESKLRMHEQDARLASASREELAKLALEQAASNMRLAVKQQEIELSRLRQESENLVSANGIACRVIDKLPELAAQMPDIHELKVLQTGNSEYNALASFIARMMAMVESLNP
jgi:hypothetical protein